jgi:hypothetical protein
MNETENRFECEKWLDGYFVNQKKMWIDYLRWISRSNSWMYHMYRQINPI